MKSSMFLAILFMVATATAQTTTTNSDCTINSTGANTASADCTRTTTRTTTTPSLENTLKHEGNLNRDAARAAEQRAVDREAAKDEAQKQEVFSASPEGQREAKLGYEARADQEINDNELTHKMWLAQHPEYNPTEANNVLMDAYIDSHNLNWHKTKSYDKAFKALSKAGLLVNR